MTEAEIREIEDGRWYPWSMEWEHICCDCGLTHRVEVRVDRGGRLWMKWARIGNEP